MSKKANIEELLKRRDRLTERIKELQEVELKGVATWVQQTTGCYSVDQLQKEGWILTKKQPKEEDAAPAPEDEQTDGETKVVHYGHDEEDEIENEAM